MFSVLLSHAWKALLVGLAISALVAGPVAAASTSYTYDALGRLISVAESTGTIIVYRYDAAGNRIQVHNALGFYRPVFRVMKAGVTGATIGSANFDIPTANGPSALMSTPPSLSFSYEIDVTAAGAASGYVGVASQAWFDAGGQQATTTPGAAHWHVGQSTSFGAPSGATAVWSSAAATLAQGDVVGVTYSATNGKTRVYRNGVLVGTITASSSLIGAQMYPMLASGSGRFAGGFRTVPSEHHAAYVTDVGVPNTSPVTVNDSVNAVTGVTLTVSPLGNDSDPDGDSLTILSVATPGHGTATINAGLTTIAYTATGGYFGPDSFTYTVSDGRGGASTATVNVTVAAPPNTPPVAVNDSTTATASVAKVITPLTNDTDANGDTLTITARSTPTNGTATINAGSTSLTYTANAGYVGSDSFTYTISDGRGGTATATISITVSNTAPVAVNDSTTATASVAKVITPLTNDTDANGDTLTVTARSTPTNGTATINAGSTSLTYTANAGYVGSDSFTYTISDGKGGTATATISITVSNTAPVAVNDSTTATASVAKVITPLTNDTDANGDTLTITARSTPTNGTATINAGSTSLTYTANAGYVGSDSFTYTISDGKGGTATATISITVSNTAPVAVNDSVSATTATALIVTPLVNDTDVNGDTLTIASRTTPTHGTATINAGSTTLTYTSAAGYVGSDSFSYTIGDGKGGSATATVNITVTAAPNTAPVAVNDTGGATAGVAASISPLTNDTDANGDPLTISAVGTPAHGVATINAGSTTLTYTATVGYAGPDSFTYTISDGRGGSATATISITVSAPANAAPVAVNDAVNAVTAVALNITPLTNDTDANGHSLTITGVGTPAHGTATVNAGSTSVTYTSAAGYAGADSFTYAISDGNGGTASATISVTVAGPPPANEWATMNIAQVGEWWDGATGIPYAKTLVNDFQGYKAYVVTKTPGDAYYGGGATNSGSFGLTALDAAGNKWSVTPGQRIGTAFDVRSLGVTDQVKVTFFYWTSSWSNGGSSAAQTLAVSKSGWTRLELIDTVPTNAAYVAVIVEALAAGDKRRDHTHGVAIRRPQFSRLSTGQPMPPSSETTPLPNTAPSAVNDPITVTAGGWKILRPLANDIDANSDWLTITQIGTPSHGTATIAPDQISVTYTPTPGYTGSDSFTYSISDGRGGTSSAVVNLTVATRAPFSDDFNRANEALDASPNWDLVGAGGIIVVASNRIDTYWTTFGPGLGAAALSPDLETYNHYVQSTVGSWKGAPASFTVARFTDIDNWVGIRFNTGDGPPALEVFTRIGGTFTLIARHTGYWPENDIMQLRIVGDTYELRINGTTAISPTTITMPPPATRTGIFSSGGGTTNLADNYQAGPVN